MISWLYLYLVGCLPVMLAVALIAFERRKSHGMRSQAVTQLTLFGGPLRLLLAVAAVQVIGLLVLAKVLGSARALGGRVREPAVEPAEELVPTSLATATAAA
jgi:predicted lysophospholipase L1 biosynthesis ABC-type transport system permease subunit